MRFTYFLVVVLCFTQPSTAMALQTMPPPTPTTGVITPAPEAGDYAVQSPNSNKNWATENVEASTPGTDQNRLLIGRLKDRINENVVTIHKLGRELKKVMNECGGGRSCYNAPAYAVENEAGKLPTAYNAGSLLSLADQKAVIASLTDHLRKQIELITRLRARISSLRRQ